MNRKTIDQPSRRLQTTSEGEEPGLKLEPTASLVMRWALPLYEEGPVRNFIDQMDLSSGDELLSRCNQVCEWYGEVILNRKHFIKHQIKELLKARLGKSQVVVLGAGKSPLALELILECPSKIYRVFEVDISGMEDKKRLYETTEPRVLGMLRCITADITSSHLKAQLMETAMYSSDLPAIVVMEGISYYISRKALKNIFSTFRSGKRNRMVIEYLHPYSEVGPSESKISEGIFSIIQDAAGMEVIRFYNDEDIKRLFEEAGGELIAACSMKEMEMARCGANKFFDQKRKGWIGCAAGKL
jgi:O-methyltransferase involved in polyketide biosynthesis